ncbi:MAG: hypothetical protein QOI64_2156 [Solirubrobacteraceae bacterium]|nr:hypothetical protein [Solirubrobacteraceae bacterium]
MPARQDRALDEPRPRRSRRRGMQRIGEATARAFKTLAGVETDEPAASWVFALYGFLFCIALMLVIAWLAGPS